MTDNPKAQAPPRAPLPGRRLLSALGFVVTLLAGIAIGLQLQPAATVVQVVVTATPNPASAAENADAPAAAESATDSPDLMTFLLADARHFQGDENAPVTFIEFSDFK